MKLNLFTVLSVLFAVSASIGWARADLDIDPGVGGDYSTTDVRDSEGQTLFDESATVGNENQFKDVLADAVDSLPDGKYTASTENSTGNYKASFSITGGVGHLTSIRVTKR